LVKELLNNNKKLLFFRGSWQVGWRYHYYIQCRPRGVTHLCSLSPPPPPPLWPPPSSTAAATVDACRKQGQKDKEEDKLFIARIDVAKELSFCLNDFLLLLAYWLFNGEKYCINYY